MNISNKETPIIKQAGLQRSGTNFLKNVPKDETWVGNPAKKIR